MLCTYILQIKLNLPIYIKDTYKCDLTITSHDIIFDSMLAYVELIFLTRRVEQFLDLGNMVKAYTYKRTVNSLK